MKNNIQIKRLEGFLEELFGGDVSTTASKLPAGFPVLYKMLYELRVCEIRGVKCGLVIDKGKQRLTPLTIEKHLQQITRAIDIPLVYVSFSGVEPHDVQRLIARGVPFVFPGKQLSIPFLALQLKAIRPEPFLREKFASCEQLIVLGRLLGIFVDNLTVREIAEHLGYSKPAVQIAFRTLERLGVCVLIRKPGTKENELAFLHEGKALWEYAEEYFMNPCKKSVGLLKVPAAVVAGIDALAKRSFLAEQELATTYAIDARKFKSFKLPMLTPRTTPYKLELWHYEPTILGDGEIDTLSLVLSLDRTDERVEKECRKLIEEIL